MVLISFPAKILCKFVTLLEPLLESQVTDYACDKLTLLSCKNLIWLNLNL